jgi:hypothetical protein
MGWWLFKLSRSRPGSGRRGGGSSSTTRRVFTAATGTVSSAVGVLVLRWEAEKLKLPQ